MLFHRLQSTPPPPQREQPSSHGAPGWHGSAPEIAPHTHTHTLSHTLLSSRGVCVCACICNEEGTRRFTVLAPGPVKWVDRCHFPHQLPINVPCFVFLFKKPMKRISKMRKWQADLSRGVHLSITEIKAVSLRERAARRRDGGVWWTR